MSRQREEIASEGGPYGAGGGTGQPLPPEPRTVLGSGQHRKTDGRRLGDERVAAVDERRVDRHARKVDVRLPRPNAAPEELRRPVVQVARLVELFLPRNVRALEIVGALTHRSAVDVRRGVALGRLGEGGDERSRGAVVRPPRPFEEVRRITLVVAADEAVVVSHRRGVNGVPVEGTHLGAVRPVEPQERHRPIELVLVAGALLEGVAVVRDAGSVGRRPAELRPRDSDSPGRQAGVRIDDRAMDPAHDRLEVLSIEAERRQVVERVMRVAARPAVRV